MAKSHFIEDDKGNHLLVQLGFRRGLEALTHLHQRNSREIYVIPLRLVVQKFFMIAAFYDNRLHYLPFHSVIFVSLNDGHFKTYHVTTMDVPAVLPKNGRLVFILKHGHMFSTTGVCVV